ncbi:MAG: glutathione S-transferase family protein [Proteobacteria bacterium]|nr:glutathione S-transferase family protein [Pseudomonadota bacterium]
MLKIYHTPPSRSVRVVWLAEEMRIPYEAVAVPFGPGEKPAGFVEASPLGALPAITDGEVSMIESVAIMQYLMAKYGPTELAVAPSEKDFANYLQYLEFGESGLCAIGNAFVATRFQAPEDAKKNWTLDYVVSAINKRMKLVQARLEAGNEYMAAGRFTGADISVGWAIGIAKYFGIVTEFAPSVQAYHERVTARPAYKKAAG